MQTTVDEWGAAKKILRPGPPHLPPSDEAGIRSQRLPSSEVRHPAAARRRETGYCRPDVEGRRPAGGGGVLPPRLLRAAARPREIGYCRPAVEGSRPPGPRPSSPRLSECHPARAPPVRVSPSATRPAPLRSADDRTFRLRPEPVRTCSAPSRPASPGAMRRSAAAPRARRCPIRRCAA